MTTELLTQRHNHVLVMTLSGPATCNAMNAQVYAAGTEALHVAEANPEIKGIVLTGAGSHFCAGRDIRQIMNNRARNLQQEADQIDAFHRWIEDLCSFPKPVLAAVEGVTAGAGLSLMLACDVVVASHGARFLSAYSALGLPPDGGLTWQLARRLPRAQALQWLWDNRERSAQELLNWGLVQKLTPAREALPTALSWAETLANISPSVLATGKDLLRSAEKQSLSQQLEQEKHHFMVHLPRPETGTALDSFGQRKKM